MKDRNMVSVKRWVKLAGALAVGCVLFSGFAFENTAQAQEFPRYVSEFEYLQMLARYAGERLPEMAPESQWVNWALDRGIAPKDGWNPDRFLTREVFAETLAQLLELNPADDPIRELEMEGIVIPEGRLVTRETVLNTLWDIGFQSPRAEEASNPGSPVGPREKVSVCHRGRTIFIAEPAVVRHLGHGDTLGPCP